MPNFSKFLSLISGADRTVDLSATGNVLELGGAGLQMDGSTSGHIVVSASATTATYSIVWPAAQAASMGYVLTNDGTGVLSWAPTAAAGVTSVAFADDSTSPIYSVSGSPVTSTGTLAITLATQSANTVFAGPTTGSAAQPTFRSLVSADIPNNAANTTGTAANVTGIVALINGGTGTAAGSANAAFAALSPLTTAGDLLFENATPAPARLPIGSNGNILTVVSGLPAWAPASPTGVTSVAFADDSSTPIYAVSGSPVTSTGTLAITLETQTAATVFAGPVSGGSAQPTFRALTSTDIPNLSAIYLPLAGGTMTGAINLGGFAPTNSGTPVNPNDLVNKSYVDNFINATSWKNAVLVATTANITLSGEQTIDGFLTSSSRVLVKNQSAPADNGIYVSAAGAWTRAVDMNTWAEVPAAAVFVQEGTVNADLGFVCVSQPGGTLGTTAINWVQFSSAGAYSADGVTLQLIGGVFSIKNAGVTETQIASTSFSTTGAISGGSGTKISVNVDNSTIDINGSDQLEVKAGGITSTQLASASVTAAKLGTVTDGVTLDQAGAGSTIEIKTGGVGTTQLAAASVTAAKLGAVTDGVTLDQSGAGSTIEVKAAGISATQLATGAFDQVTITGGAGTPASVVATPAMKRTLIAGQTFAANTSYAVRWGLTANGETAGRVYAADITTSSFDLFYVIGMAVSPAGVTAGGSITVTSFGSFSLSSADTAFAVSTDGLAVFLTASGTFSTTPPSAAGTAVTRIGIVEIRSATVTSNIIDVDPIFVAVN